MGLASYVGCWRVVFVAQTATFVSCQQHVVTRRWSCRRHKKMSCRQGVQNDTTFEDMSGDSRLVGNFVELKHKNSMIAKVPVCLD
jgi:hypothetical protein